MCDFKIKRKEMKKLHELNQYIKTVFSEFRIKKNYVYGVPAKGKITTGLFKILIDDFNFLEGYRLDCNAIYTAFKNMKPTRIDVIDDEVILTDEEINERVIISKNTRDRNVYNTRVFDMMREVAKECREETIKLPLEIITSASNYDRFRMNIGLESERIIDFSISVIPIIKKMKNCTITSYGKRILDGVLCFDAIFSAVDTKVGIQFSVARRFVDIYTGDDI